MQYFQKIGEGLPLTALSNQVHREIKAWGETFILRLRQAMVDDPMMKQFPEAKRIALALMGSVGATAFLSAALWRIEHARSEEIAAPEAGGAADAARYVVMLYGKPGCLFTCGDESVAMAGGEAWWMSSITPGKIMNRSQDDALFMTVDLSHG